MQTLILKNNNNKLDEFWINFETYYLGSQFSNSWLSLFSFIQYKGFRDLIILLDYILLKSEFSFTINLVQT